MPNLDSAPADRARFDEYCIRHGVRPDAALAELVVIALSLPTDVLDYLRAERVTGCVAA